MATLPAPTPTFAVTDAMPDARSGLAPSDEASALRTLVLNRTEKL